VTPPAPLAAAGLALLAAFATALPAAAETTDRPAATKVATVSDPRISESSALVASPTHDDLVWTVNDSGHTASVFGVRPSTGRTAVVLRLRDTDARDWESMAAQRLPDGTGVLWVGDTGDNNAVRGSIVLRLVREPRHLPRAGATVVVTPVSLRVRYPDGPHDVEALVATRDGRLLLVTKQLFAGVVYQVPPRAVAQALAGRSVLDPVTARNVGGVAQSLVTDGTSLPDGRIVLRGYVDAVVYADRTRSDRGLAAERRIALPAQQQGETLTAVDDGAALLVGSEGVQQPLWRVPLSRPARTPTPAAGRTSAGAGSPTSGPGWVGGDPAMAWAIGAALGMPVALLVVRARRRRRERP
jgi:hypothetical protein